METPSFIRAPGGEAFEWMLRGFGDDVAYAGLNDGNELNLPLYFDVLRQLLAPKEAT